MRIILDGPDGVGKSTLAKKIQERFNITSYIHLTGNDPKDFNFYDAMISKTDVIFDRSFLSERIYAKVFEREPVLTLKELSLLTYTAEEKDIIVIICLAEKENIRYHSDEDERIIENEDILNKYFTTIAETLNYCVARPLDKDYDEKALYEYIEQRIKKNKAGDTY